MPTRVSDAAVPNVLETTSRSSIGFFTSEPSDSENLTGLSNTLTLTTVSLQKRKLHRISGMHTMM